MSLLITAHRQKRSNILFEINSYNECIENAIDSCLDVKILDFQNPEK